jgi:hypothetical protein
MRRLTLPGQRNISPALHTKEVILLDRVSLAQRLVNAIFKFALIDILRRLTLNRDREIDAEIGEVG